MSKKLIIAFTALALAILAGAVAVVAVFAAQQQKVANTFTITYTANNVSAGVYFEGCDEKSTNYFEYPESAPGNMYPYNYIDASQEEKTNAYALPDYTLAADNKYVLIHFRIKNNNSEGGKSMTVTFYNDAKMENINVYYDLDAASGFSIDDLTDANKALPEVQTLAPQGVLEGAILIRIADLTLDAEFISTAEAGLGFTLNAVE